MAAHDTLKLVQDLKTESERAERILARVQNYRDEAGVPAINEIRYAAYHLTESVSDSGQIDNEQELLKAVRHYQRATYEASEAGILHALQQIKKFQSDYSSVVIGEIVDGWHDCLTICQEAQDNVGTDRETGDDRDLDHAAHEKRFDQLVDISRKCDVARDDLNAKIRADIISTRRFTIGTLIAIGGLGAAIAALL